MTKFLKVGDYQPQDYTKSDYMLYRYLYRREVRASTAVSSESDARNELFNFHREQLKLSRGSDGVYEAFDRDLIIHWKFYGADGVLGKLENVPADWLYDSVEKLAFLAAMRIVSDVETHQVPYIASGYAPRNRSLQYLKEARALLTRDNVTPEIQKADAANLDLVNAIDFEKQCKQEFLQGRPIVETGLAKGSRAPSRPVSATVSVNAGLFVKIYHHPAFQHWLTQMILAAIVLTAALVMAAFMLNASMLPLAVAGVVKGLSSMAAKAVFGSALVVGTTAAVTLAASLHARFFSEAGSVPPAGAGLTLQPSVVRR